MAILTDRKLFAKGFLSGVTPPPFIPTGNCSQKVSYPAWHHSYPYRQETICERFPIRLGTIAILTDRKLFAKGFSGKRCGVEKSHFGVGQAYE